MNTAISQPHPSKPLFPIFVGTAFILLCVHIGLIAWWGPGPRLADAPWLVPLMHGFMVMAIAIVSFLALGRYGVLRDASSYWIGSCFACGSVGTVLYILTWPGLTAAGGSMIGRLPGTPAWIVTLTMFQFAAMLPAAALAPWPRHNSLPGRRWVWCALSWPVSTVLIIATLLFFEPVLPLLVAKDGSFTLLYLVLTVVQLVLFAAGAALSVRRYVRPAGNNASIYAYVAFAQLFLAFALADILVGGKRYDFWWYAARLLGASGYVVLMTGLLAEYVSLYKTEKDRSAQLQRNEERLKALYGSMSEGLAYHEIVYEGQTAADYIILDVNPAFERFTGIARKDAVGKKASVLYGTGTPPYLDIYARVAQSGNPEHFETEFSPMGKHFSISVFSPEKGKFATVFTDITDRKNAEKSTFDINAALERRVVEQTAELRAAYQTLERRVAERTGQVREANQSLELARKAALNIMQDAIAAGRRAEKARVELAFVSERRGEALAAQEQLVSRLDILSHTASELLQTSEPQKLVESLCTKVMEHLGCHVFFNFLVDGKAGKLHLNACAGIPPGEAAKMEWLDYGSAVCGCVARDGERIVAGHIPTTPDARTDLVRSYGIKAYACHPLMSSEGTVMGTLSFGTRDRETFSKDDLSLMKAVADQVVTAMVHVKDRESLKLAHDELEQRVAERTADQLITNSILQQFAHTSSKKAFLDAAVRIIRGWSACEFVGVRIRDQHGNIPFESHLGFDEEFLAVENALHVDRDNCICIRAIVERVQEQERKFVSAGGSFSINDTGEFLSGLSRNERGEYRGACMDRGFRSLAVVPIRFNNQVFGAIHLADHKSGMARPQTVHFLEETIAPLVGEALQRFYAEAELESHHLHVEELVEQRTKELKTANDALTREMQRREELSRDLVRSNNDLEQFAYVASHDLQEPLRAVSGFVELLKRHLSGTLDEKRTEYFNFIVDGVDRMQSLINGLLEYSRVGTRGKAPELAGMKDALDHALLNLHRSVEESGAQVEAGELPSVVMDPLQLQQLFQNLLGNAIKFRSAETPPRITVNAERGADEWLIAVRDNGIGIDPQFAQRIFLIFQRLHTRSEYPGTGIGLAVCKKIVERHGGRIWVESKPGAGAAFFFTIPDKGEA